LQAGRQTIAIDQLCELLHGRAHALRNLGGWVD
jgi:hypothetical protein